jgi:hypothetical protein
MRRWNPRTRKARAPGWKNLEPRPFGIISLGETSCKIFGSKRLIRKIFQNKDLHPRSFGCAQDFGRGLTPANRLNLALFLRPMKKGGGVIPHPLDLDFFSIVLFYQFQPAHLDNVSVFIFLASSSTYRQNRQNRGLTRFPSNLRGSCERSLPTISWAVRLRNRLGNPALHQPG